MARVAVLGGGAMGLAAAYEALKQNHSVALFEAAPEPGGMAAHFDLDGLSIERYYHFICKSDQATFKLLSELGIEHLLHWRPTSMGYFIGGELHRWGDPLALIKFPHLDALSKLRYGLLMFLSTQRRSWDALEHQAARQWIERWCGRRVYLTLWKTLFDLKFHEFAEDISARWIWTRIHRIGRSRRSILQEELGYLEGGSNALVQALVTAIESGGGSIRLNEAVVRVLTNEGQVTGVQTAEQTYPCDAVISTMPTPHISSIVPSLSDGERAAYDNIKNIGVVCVVLKLEQQVSPHFWVNIVDPALNIPGLIEFSNLRPIGTSKVVYVPFYMPVSNPLWSRSDEEFVEDAMKAVTRVNPKISHSHLLASSVGRLRYAQPVCPPGFSKQLPPIQTSISGLQIADTCFYYPEDRGISESVRMGRQMAANI
jgi:protoporphyrinogen oxidase